MPLVEITLVEGRTPEQLRALLHEVHAAVVRTVSVPAESVRVVIREVSATHWAAGDVTIAERREGSATSAPVTAPSPDWIGGPDWIGSTGGPATSAG